MVHRSQVEVDELLGPQARRVGQLEQGAVAQLQRCAGGNAVQEVRDLGRLERPRQAPPALRRGQEVGRVLLDLAVLDERAVERPQRGDLAGDRAGCAALLGQRGRVSAQVAGSDPVGRQAATAGPARELAEVDRVRAPGLLGCAATTQVAVERDEGVRPGVARLLLRGGVLHRHSHRSDRHPEPASGGGRRDGW